MIEEVSYPTLTGPVPALANDYLGVAETAIVVDLVSSVAPKVVLEIGVNQGKTARAILDAMPEIERYIGIDLPTDATPRLGCQYSEVPVVAGRFAANDPRFWLLLGESTTIEAHDLEPIDAAFIDGDHSAIGVEHDSRLARALLRPGGVIVWHDCGNPNVEVTDVLDRLAGEGWPICHVMGTWLAYMRN
jgi:predicted O-methyltransferase YrrM